MALFGSRRDINVFLSVNNELLNKIICQEVLYYKIDLDTKTNIYGESTNKFYTEPILITCLIERGDVENPYTDFGPDTEQIYQFKFLREHLKSKDRQNDLVPEIGDIIMFNEYYWEVDGINENQLIVGKQPETHLSDSNETFGNSFSIIVSSHKTRLSKTDINNAR